MDVPNSAAGGGGSIVDWRIHLDPKARGLNSSMIFKTLKKHLPLPDLTVSERLNGIAKLCEDKIYRLSTNQVSYEHNIFQSILKMVDIKKKYRGADVSHRSAVLPNTWMGIQQNDWMGIQQNELSTSHQPVQGSLQEPSQIVMGQHGHQQPSAQETQQNQQPNIPLHQPLIVQKQNLHRNQLIDLENSVVEMQQQQGMLAPANSLLNMQQKRRTINQQAMSLQSQLQNSPPSSNLVITGRTLASDAGNPIVDLSLSKEAQLDNAGRNLVTGTERTGIIQPYHDDAKNRHVEHDTYAALLIEDYNLEHWNREHISTVLSVAKPHTADPICIYGNNYIAVLITVKAEHRFSLPSMAGFKNHNGMLSFRRVSILLTENNDDSDDENFCEQFEQSNDNPVPPQPLVPNQLGPSSGTGAAQRRISLQPVPIGKFGGKILCPTAHGKPITSKPKVYVSMHCGYFKVSAYGSLGESCHFRIPMQPLMDEGSVGLLMADICTASVGFITEIGTVDPMHQLTVIVDIIRSLQCVNNISLSRAQVESPCVQTEDPLPKLLSLTGPMMETGTADMFELSNPSENSSTMASVDPVHKPVRTPLQQPATQENMSSLQQHEESPGAVPNVPNTQRMHRIQQTKAEVQQEHAQQSLTELVQPQSQQAQLQQSHRHNQIQQILPLQHPPMQQNFQSSADQRRHHSHLVDHHNQFPSQGIARMPLHLANSSLIVSPSPPVTPFPIIVRPESAQADGSQADMPTQDPTEILKAERSIDRLVKAFQQTRPQHISAACSDMRASLDEYPDAIAMPKSHSQANFIGHDTITSKNMKRAMSVLHASSAGNVNYYTDLQSTTISHVKRQKVMVELPLAEEIKEIENKCIDTELHVQDGAATNSLEAEGTVIKCTFTALHVCPDLFTSGKMSPISLRLLIPASYPKCRPVILDKFPAEQRSSDDLNTKAMSKFEKLLYQDLGKTISLQHMVKTWYDCVCAVILEYAQQTAGGSFTSSYGRWESWAGV